jgi:hypothetical protein
MPRREPQPLAHGKPGSSPDNPVQPKGPMKSRGGSAPRVLGGAGCSAAVRWLLPSLVRNPWLRVRAIKVLFWKSGVCRKIGTVPGWHPGWEGDNLGP